MALERRESKATDAAKAAEVERDITDPKDRVENLREQLKNSPEEKLAAGDVQGAELARQALGLLERVILNKDVTAATVVRAPAIDPLARQRCPTCDQPMSVCKGEHEMVMVAPQERRFWRSFQGVIVNGITYVGPCLVAKSQKHVILGAVRRFEKREADLFIPGGRDFGDYAMLGGGRAFPAAGTTPLL